MNDPGTVSAEENRRLLPGPRCGQYVSGYGMSSSYPCCLDANHPGAELGKHVAIEVPQSRVHYEAWLATIVQPSPYAPVPTGPVAGVPSPPAVLSPAVLEDPLVRASHEIGKIRNGDLPRWMQDSLRDASARVSLAVLWVLAQKEFANGAGAVMVTQEFLERLVTPHVRQFLDLLMIQETTDARTVSLPPQG